MTVKELTNKIHRHKGRIVFLADHGRDNGIAIPMSGQQLIAALDGYYQNREQATNYRYKIEDDLDILYVFFECGTK